MKGNNLRLFVDGYAIAAAKSCNIQLQAQTEDESSKDTPLDYQQLIVTGKSATISAEALYVPASQLTPFANPTWKTVTGYEVATNHIYHCISGNTFIIHTLDGEMVDAAIFIIDDGEVAPAPLFAGTDTRLAYICPDGSDGDTIVFGFKNQADLNRVAILAVDCEDDANNLDTILAAYNSSRDVEVKLSTTEGNQNREVVEDIVSFVGKITDMSVESVNRQSVTFSCQISAEMIE